MISIPEDRDFILFQRQKGHRPTGSIGAADMVETRRRQRALERREVKQKRKKRSHKELAACTKRGSSGYWFLISLNTTEYDENDSEC